MRITHNQRKSKDTEIYEVYADGQFVFNVPGDIFLSLALYDREEIESDELARIKDFVLISSAKSAALKSLTMKMTSRKEAQQKLIEKGFDINIADLALDALTSLGYVNDKMYTMKYISDRLRLKPKSKQLIKFELISKGVEPQIVEDILSEWSVDEDAVAEGLVRKKFGKYDFNNPMIIKKIFSFLQHRGYDYETISKIVEKVKKY